MPGAEPRADQLTRWAERKGPMREKTISRRGRPFPVREKTTMQATCANGHENNLGDLPLGENVRWECPTCQSVEVVTAAGPVPDDVRFVTDGDTGSSSEG